MVTVKLLTYERVKCGVLLVFFFFKQKTAYEMRISDWSSDVCSSDLPANTTLTFCHKNAINYLLTVTLMTHPEAWRNCVLSSISGDQMGIFRSVFHVGRLGQPILGLDNRFRSEERRVGKECVRQWTSRGSQFP